MNDAARRKITVVGPTGVGKTSLVTRMCYDCFDTESPTLGASYSSTEITGIDHQPYVLDFWDTAGLEKFATVIPIYYPNTFIFWFVFDLSDEESFDRMIMVSLSVFQRVKNDVRIYLIGNKMDLAQNIPWMDKVRNFMRRLNNITYFQTSAKTGEGIPLIKYQLESDCVLNPVSKECDVVDIEKPVVQNHTEDKNKKCC